MPAPQRRQQAERRRRDCAALARRLDPEERESAAERDEKQDEKPVYRRDAPVELRPMRRIGASASVSGNRRGHLMSSNTGRIMRKSAARVRRYSPLCVPVVTQFVTDPGRTSSSKVSATVMTARAAEVRPGPRRRASDVPACPRACLPPGGSVLSTRI